MFDVGFWEMGLLGIIALVVIGPERMPAVARQVGRWVGQMRRVLDEVKADFAKEIQVDEIKKLGAVKDEISTAAKELSQLTQPEAAPAARTHQPPTRPKPRRATARTKSRPPAT